MKLPCVESSNCPTKFHNKFTSTSKPYSVDDKYTSIDKKFQEAKMKTKENKQSTQQVDLKGKLNREQKHTQFDNYDGGI